MANTADERAARRERHRAILAEVAQEESEAAEVEVAEQESALDVPLHLRIDRSLDARLHQFAAAEHIPMSALVRRLLRQSLSAHPLANPTVGQIEEIARRVVREELQEH